MVAIWNIKRISEMFDRLEYVVCRLRMRAHDDPFRICERARLSEDVIWDSNFSDVVQESTAANIF